MKTNLEKFYTLIEHIKIAMMTTRRPDGHLESRAMANQKQADGAELLQACGIDAALPSGQEDPGVLVADDAASATDDFVAAIAKHRHFARETDPPRV